MHFCRVGFLITIVCKSYLSVLNIFFGKVSKNAVCLMPPRSPWTKAKVTMWSERYQLDNGYILDLLWCILTVKVLAYVHVAILFGKVHVNIH